MNALTVGSYYQEMIIGSVQIDFLSDIIGPGYYVGCSVLKQSGVIDFPAIAVGTPDLIAKPFSFVVPQSILKDGTLVIKLYRGPPESNDVKAKWTADGNTLVGNMGKDPLYNVGQNLTGAVDLTAGLLKFAPLIVVGFLLLEGDSLIHRGGR